MRSPLEVIPERNGQNRLSNGFKTIAWVPDPVTAQLLAHAPVMIDMLETLVCSPSLSTNERLDICRIIADALQWGNHITT
jgi:hypothetical protein